MLAKVISGGQTGADQAGLRAAKAAGLATGGWMPKGFKTETVPRPEFATLYGVREHPSPEYPPRTEQNVGDAAATIWFPGFETGDSRGFGCTIRAAKKFERPFLLIAPRDPLDDTVDRVADWIWREGFPVLNVAGSRESRSPGIGRWVEGFLSLVFRKLATR